jgi:hypothetical protein
MPTTFTFKTIKTPKMNVQPMRGQIQAAVQAEAKFQKRELLKTVSAWKRKPKFVQETAARDPDLIVSVGPDASDAGKRWGWINDGVAGRTITAKRAPFLKFRSNYSPSTRAGWFGSHPSGSWGQWVRKRSVNWKGIEARDWTNILSKKRQRPFRDRILKASKAGANGFFPG